jgi:hypothetical protein
MSFPPPLVRRKVEYRNGRIDSSSSRMNDAKYLQSLQRKETKNGKKAGDQVDHRMSAANTSGSGSQGHS